MPNIVAGIFEDQPGADAAMRALAEAGFVNDAIASFVHNAPGQHAGFPIGGDKLADETARGSEKGSLAGAGIGTGVGAAVGAASAPFIGPLGIAAGAATGALVGAISGTMSKLSENAEARGDPPERPAGVMVAVHAPQVDQQERALSTLVRAGARAIETAEGTWRDGQWVDYDPTAVPEAADQVHRETGRGSR